MIDDVVTSRFQWHCADCLVMEVSLYVTSTPFYIHAHQSFPLSMVNTCLICTQEDEGEHAMQVVGGRSKSKSSRITKQQVCPRQSLVLILMAFMRLKISRWKR